MNFTTESFLLQEAIDGGVYNVTTESPHLNITAVPNVDTQLKLYDILMPALGGLIVVTNLLVVLSSGLLLKKGASPRTTYLFLGNVAMADLITGIAYLLGQFYPKSYRTHLICAIQIGLIVSSTLASVYSVGLIAIDRFLYIVHGLKYHRWMYPARARHLIGVTWAIGIILGFLPATGLWSGETQNGRICWFISLAPPGLILLITIVGLLPILLVISLYGIILYHAIKKVIQLRRADKNQQTRTMDQEGNMRIFRGGGTAGNETAQQSERKKPSKIKAVKVVVFTCGSFILTWLPYFVASSMYVFIDQNSDTGKGLRVAIASPLAILGFVNSLLNPLIYAWWHNGFRAFIRKTLCKRRERSQQQSTSTGKSSLTTGQSRTSGKSTSSGDQSDGNMHSVNLRKA